MKSCINSTRCTWLIHLLCGINSTRYTSMIDTFIIDVLLQSYINVYLVIHLKMYQCIKMYNLLKSWMYHLLKSCINSTRHTFMIDTFMIDVCTQKAVSIQKSCINSTRYTSMIDTFTIDIHDWYIYLSINSFIYIYERIRWIALPFQRLIYLRWIHLLIYICLFLYRQHMKKTHIDTFTHL